MKSKVSTIATEFGGNKTVICFTLPSQALTRAGFKGISQPRLSVTDDLSTPGELRITLL